MLTVSQNMYALILPLLYLPVNGNQGCFDETFTEKVCCYPLHSEGDDQCWDSTYSFEYCCARLLPNQTAEENRLKRLSKQFEGDECWFAVFTEETCCNPTAKGGNPLCWEDPRLSFSSCCAHKIKERASNGWCWADKEIRNQDIWYFKADWVSDAILAYFGIDYRPTITEFSENRCCHPLPLGRPSCWQGEYSFENCCSHLGDLPAHEVRQGQVYDDALCLKRNERLQQHNGILYPLSSTELRYFGRPDDCMADGGDFRWAAAHLIQNEALLFTMYTGVCTSKICSEEKVTRIVDDYIHSVATTFDSRLENSKLQSFSKLHSSFFPLLFQAVTGTLFLPLLILFLPVVIFSMLHMSGRKNRMSFQSSMEKVRSVGTSGRMRNHDVLRTVCVLGMLFHHINIEHMWRLDENWSRVNTVVDRLLHFLVNNCIFFLAGYFMARRGFNVGFGMIFKKLYRQAPVTFLVSYVLEHQTGLFSRLNHMLVANSDGTYFANYQHGMYSSIGVPWSLFPVLPGVHYHLTHWAMSFEWKVFLILLTIRWLNTFHIDLGYLCNLFTLFTAAFQCMWRTEEHTYCFYIQSFCWPLMMWDRHFHTNWTWTFILWGVATDLYHCAYGIDEFGISHMSNYVMWFTSYGRVPFFCGLFQYLQNSEGELNPRVKSTFTKLCHVISLISMCTIFSHPLVYDLFQKVWFVNEREFEWQFAVPMMVSMCITALFVGFMLFACIEHPWNNLLLLLEDILLQSLKLRPSPCEIEGRGDSALLSKIEMAKLEKQKDIAEKISDANPNSTVTKRKGKQNKEDQKKMKEEEEKKKREAEEKKKKEQEKKKREEEKQKKMQEKQALIDKLQRELDELNEEEISSEPTTKKD